MPYQEYFQTYVKTVKDKLKKNESHIKYIDRAREVYISKPDTINLDSERQLLFSKMTELIFNGCKKGELNLISAPTGLGKNYCLEKNLCNFIRDWSEELQQKKILLLSPTKELSSLGYREITKNMESSDCEKVIFIEGRSADKDSPFYCYDNGRAYFLGRQRHFVECRCGVEAFEVMDNGKKIVITQECSWRKRRKELEKALNINTPTICCSTYQSFINDGKFINKFDLVIIDESILNANLYEAVTIREDDLKRAFEFINKHHKSKYPETDPAWNFLQCVSHVFTKAHELQGTYDHFNFAAVLDDINPDLDLDAIIASESKKKLLLPAFLLETIKPGLKAFGTEEEIPFKWFEDLVVALASNHQVIVNCEGIKFCRQYRGLEYLRSMAVINLDATPCLSLLRDIWGTQNIKVHCNIDSLAPLANVTVTQLYGQVFTKSILRISETKGLVEVIVDFYLKRDGIKKPLFVVHKDLLPAKGEEVSNPDALALGKIDAKFISFGGETRGSNEFQECDSVFIVGHYQRPALEVELMVNCLRKSRYNRSLSLMFEAYRPMMLVGNSFSVPARLQAAHSDPLVRECIEHFMCCEILQAFGRLRSLCRQDEKFNVYILDGYQYPLIPVDTADEIKYLKRYLKKSSSKRLPEILTSKNAEAYEQNRTTILELLRIDVQLNPADLRKITGLHPTTVQKHYDIIKGELK